MDLIRYPQLKSLTDSSCITIGNFDGVHLGHQALIKQVVGEAEQRDCLSVVVAMQPLPLQFFKGKQSVDILTAFRHKYLLLEQLGVDVFCQLNFNANLANMAAESFYQQILCDGLRAEYILVGDDFKFGAHRQGDFKVLRSLADSDGVEVEQMHSVTQQQQRISSTVIRSLLKAGHFNQAKAMLGRDFNLLGRVAHGQKLGRELGYPTINLELVAGGFPLHGIYVCEIIIANQRHQGVASVGYNPSVGGNAKRVEVYVLDFNQQVYGQCVEVLFYKKLRNEVEFSSLDELIVAIEKDVSETRDYFADLEGEPV